MNKTAHYLIENDLISNKRLDNDIDNNKDSFFSYICSCCTIKEKKKASKLPNSNNIL